MTYEQDPSVFFDDDDEGPDDSAEIDAWAEEVRAAVEGGLA